MKKRKKRIVAFVLAVSMIFGHMYIYAKAENAASKATTPEIGNYSNLVNLEDTAFYNSKENYGPIDLSETVQGDTWYFGVTVNFTKLSAWQGPMLAFATGTVCKTNDETTTTTDDMMIRLQIRNTAENKGQYVLNCASKPMYNPESIVPKAGDIGFSFETGKDYRVTIKVSGKDKLSLWIDENKIIDELSLAEKGITNLKPCIGWRCYISTGILKDIQVWDEVTVKPVFDELVDRNASLVSELSLEAPDGCEEKYLEHTRYGSRYYFSGRVNAENTQDAGSMRFLVAEVQNGDNTNKISVCLRPGSIGTDTYNQIAVFSNDGNTGEKALYLGKIPSRICIGSIYTYTAIYENGAISFYVDDVLAVNRLKLEGTVTPRVGLYADHCLGEVTDIRLWGDVDTDMVKPIFQEGAGSNSAILEEIPIAASKESDPVIYAGIAYEDTYYYSGTVQITEADSEAENYGIGMILGTATCQGETAYMEARYQPERKHALLLLRTASGETVLKDVALDESTAPTTNSYTYTGMYDRGEVSFWVDDTLIFSRENIRRTEGVTEVLPQAGACGSQCDGSLSDIKIWGETERTEQIFFQKFNDITTYRTFGNHSSLIDLADTEFVSARNKEAVDLSEVVQGDTWYLGVTINFANLSAWNGPELAFATGTVSRTTSDGITTTADDMLIRLQVRNNDVNKGQYVLNCASKPMYTYGNTVLKAGDIGFSFETGIDYRVTIKASGKDKLSLWIDENKIIDELSLAEKGITDLKPCVGWRNYGAAGTFKNIQVWDEPGNHTAPLASGYVFAGWYQDAEGKQPMAKDADSGSAYGKFVPEKVLSIKAQVASDTTLTTAKTDLRFITTVDSLKYSEIGFDIAVGGNPAVNCPGTKVYKTILEKDGLGSVSYKPEVFHPCSVYFHAYTIKNIPSTAYSTEIKVSPYWITQDGTKVVGVTRTIQVKDGCLTTDSKDPIVEVFHDPSDEYITPLEPEKTDDIRLRVRTERNHVTSAKIQYTNDNGTTWNTVDMKFDGRDTTGYYDYFIGTIPAQSSLFYYRFLCSNTAYAVYLDRRLTLTATGGSYENCWAVNPGYATPDWSKGALWYSLIPDCFYNGDTSNDLPVSDSNRVNSWNQDRLSLDDKYGGDLAGVTEKIAHIKSLNADAVYMNPIFKSYQNFGYGQVDFMQVDASFGNAADLLKMCTVLHENGLKVMMDAVLTFSPWDSLYLDNSRRYPLDGETESDNSIYAGMYLPGEDGEKYLASGWAGPVINNSSEAAKKLFYTQEDSFLRYYPARFGVDGWRFDCGGAIQGMTADGTKEGSAEIMAKMRSYVKKDNPDTLLISEYSGDADMMGDSWDARWNDYYMKQIRAYAMGENSESTMSTILKGTVNKFPRPVALSMYNLVTSHDYERLDISDPYMEKAMILMQMNYLGSPCVYYGDEIGLGAQENTGLGTKHHVSAMDWDESNWDYERYDFYRALGELRRRYSAVKTGAIREMLVSDDQNLYAYGRWDENGTVVTVASQNEATVSADLNVRKISVADGTVFTDWLTGKQYQVDENGMLHVDVIAGGSVFVSGSEASSYRREYEITDMSGANGSICIEADGTYTLKGTGSLADSDALTLAAGNLYGAGSIYGLVKGDGKAVLTMRRAAEADAAAYNVTIDGNRLEITARRKAGGKLETIYSTEYTRGCAVRIERDADNHFYTSVADISYTGKIVSDWTRIPESETVISAGRDMIAGFAPLSGGTKLKYVQLESNTEDVLFDTFENGNGSTLLSDLTEGKATVEDGELVLHGKDGMVKVTTVGRSDDWIFKAKLDSIVMKEGAYAGVLCVGGSDQYVAAGRTVLDGKCVLYIGRSTDGTMEIDSYIEDTDPKASVILQLQRTGSSYTAVCSYDGESWRVIGGRILANYSRECPGVFASGVQASIDYVCFGDSVQDGVSVNTPHAEGVVDMNYSSTVAAQVKEAMTALSGSWEYGEQGYCQTSADGEARLAIDNKIYKDVRVNVTLKQEEGQGYAAIGFGKESGASTETEGFLLKYTTEQKLILLKNGVVLQEADAPDADDSGLRIVLEVRGEDICVYAGAKSFCVMRVRDSGYTEGYIVFATNAIKAGFRNYRISSLDAGWNQLSGTVTGGTNSITCKGTGDTYGAATRMGIGVTDFVMTSVIRLGGKTTADGPAAEGGILFGAPEGASAAKQGISVSLVSGGILRLKVDGATVKEQSLGDSVTNATLMVVRKDSLIQVYVQGREGAVLSYTDSLSRGGVVQVYSINTTATFANLGLEDITGRKASEATLYQQWQKNILPSIVKRYSEDFSSLSGWKSLTKYHADHGTWEIRDGALSCTAAPNWASGVTIYDSVYQEFSMNFKYRFDEVSNNFAGVLFHKQSIMDTNNTAKYSLLLYSSGDIALYEASIGKFVGTATISNFKVGDWYELRMVCSGDSITVYHGDKSLFSYTSSEISGSEGFVSFTSNKSLVSFDNVLIEPLK